MSDQGLSSETRDHFGAKTKGRILRAGLALFNDAGFDSVTTAQLAAAAGVLEGTLWYHFKTKKDLVLAHLDALEARLHAHLAAPFPHTDEPAATAVFDHIERAFAVLWDFRYLLRDPLQAIEREEAVMARLRDIYVGVEDRVAERLGHAEASGLLDLSGASRRTLAVTCVLVGRYWLDYARIRYADAPGSRADREGRRAMEQVLSVLRPYYTETAKALAGALERPDATASRRR